MSTNYRSTKIGEVDVSNDGDLRKTKITFEIDSHEQTTIRFGNSYTLRLSESDADTLSEILSDSLKALIVQRRSQSGEGIVETHFSLSPDDPTEDLETNDFSLCMSCQNTYYENLGCSNKECEETQSLIGSNRFFSSQIPEC